MAIDKTLHTKRDPGAASMDTIRAPGADKMKALNDKPRRGPDINAAADEIFSDPRYSGRSRFGAVNTNYESAEQRAKKAADSGDDFIPGPGTDKKARSRLDRGVKVGSSYVSLRKLIAWIVSAVVLLACLAFFFPPLMNSEETRVEHERNIFENTGMTGLKAFALSNYSVYNEEAFSSERNENYRVIEMSVHVRNASPFEVTIPQYKAAYVPKKYRDKVCYVTSAAQGAVGDTIGSFSGKDVTIEIMINVAGMTEEELDECVTGMILTTVDAKKRIADNLYVPCIPALFS